VANTKQVSVAHQRIVDRFLEERGDKPFRRQDVAETLYPHIRPRAMGNATALADTFMQHLQRAGRLVKAGHVHWRLVVPTERALKNGRQVREHAEAQNLTLTTRCPQKWVAVDLETGDVWAGSEEGWKRATDAVSREAVAILGKAAS
jgi:hypothetical protein